LLKLLNASDLNISYRPSTAGRDWLLYGKHFCDMKFICLPTSASHDWPLYGNEYCRMKFGDLPKGIIQIKILK